MVNSRTKILAGIAGIACLASVVVFIGFQYALTKHKEELVLQEKKIFDAKMQDSRLSSMERLITDTETEREELKSLVLTDEGVVDFLALIEVLGVEQGVTLETKSLNVAAINATFEEVKMTLSVGGSEQSVLHVLRLLELLPYHATVDTLTLTRVTGDGERDAWGGIFDVRVTKYKKI